MKSKVIYSRALLYSDASGIETGVAFDPTLRLGDDDHSYVEVQGVGEPIKVRIDHIPHLVEWLEEAASLDSGIREDAGAAGK